MTSIDYETAFWNWVVGLEEVDDTARGDFIRDTKDLMKRGYAPSTITIHVRFGCIRAQKEYEKLRIEFYKNQEK